nr:immunoglobulin heavy chain junction region [Mus musculus]MBK4198689.1 immunoglobulin heavy chain junction region [Mus musculus]MBK4198690.1 immunoglobulin heavy chain junction region [Mus musculus]MBK4198691.1 immunoglobulin heavy chain junction region [Mus musculus]MBK4198692.1 immunoglobulin heavy chain junction region [Mus musculus]
CARSYDWYFDVW